MKVYSYTLSLLAVIMVCTSINQLNAQTKDTLNRAALPEWKYNLPIYGKQATERGYKLQLPYGANLMYINTRVQLELTEFELSLGDGSKDDVIAEYVNVETLNFTRCEAYFNGLNFRPDFWLYPFMNVYGIVSTGAAATEVALEPKIPYGSEGDVLELPEFSSRVEFQASTIGLGSTFFAKLGQDNFVSFDGNYSWTKSDMLQDNVGVVTLSGRVGQLFEFGEKKRMLAAYVGFMYRDFTNANGNDGAVTLDEAIPGLQDQVENGIDNKIATNTDQIAENQERIDEINETPPVLQSPEERQERRTLEAKNTLLEVSNNGLDELETTLEENGFYDTNIGYFIKKEMINQWTVEFGVSYTHNEHWGFRSEIGYSEEQQMILAGLVYRFGLKK